MEDFFGRRVLQRTPIRGDFGHFSSVTNSVQFLSVGLKNEFVEYSTNFRVAKQHFSSFFFHPGPLCIIATCPVVLLNSKVIGRLPIILTIYTTNHENYLAGW